MFLYGNKDVCFESKYSIFEAVSRLSKNVTKNTWTNRLNTGILGIVEPQKAILKYFNPLGKFMGTTSFEGQFSSNDHATVLIGKFLIGKSTRAIMNIWIAFILFLFYYWRADSDLIFFPLCLLILWAGILLFLRRLIKKEIEHITDAVNDALK